MVDGSKGAGVGVGVDTNQAAMDRWDKARWMAGAAEMVSGQMEEARVNGQQEVSLLANHSCIWHTAAQVLNSLCGTAGQMRGQKSGNIKLALCPLSELTVAR